MAFGQPSGPPASAKQVRELLRLVQEAGHVDFRDARGALGLTQRQAAGKFTRDEAEALIERLEETESGEEIEEVPRSDRAASPDGARRAAPRPRVTAVERTLRGMPAELLAAELQRRGWVVMEP